MAVSTKSISHSSTSLSKAISPYPLVTATIPFHFTLTFASFSSPASVFISSHPELF